MILTNSRWTTRNLKGNLGEKTSVKELLKQIFTSNLVVKNFQSDYSVFPDYLQRYSLLL